MNIDDHPLWTALITPMNIDSGIDYPSLEKLVREQQAAGNALLVLGSTGEALNLEESERRRLLDFVLALRPGVPIMVGVGGIGIRETGQWLGYLNGLSGIDAYLLVVPPYAKPGDEGQYGWFKMLMDIAERPTMLYNVPSRTGIALSHRAVAKLSKHPRLWAIKEASGSPEQFARYGEDAPEAKLYGGDDALLPDFSALGAKGLVSVASNAWPVQCRRYVLQNLAGTFVDKKLWTEACRPLFAASNPVPVKALLAHLGKIAHPTVRTPLSAADMTGFDELLRHNENIVNWRV